MEQILLTREILVRIYKRLEVFAQPVLKFVLGLYIFTGLLGIGHVHPALAEYAQQLTSTLVAWLFALLFTVMPINLSWLLIIVTITIQLSATVELAAVVFIFLLFVFLFYARMAPKESFLIVFVMIAFRFNVPYLIPLLVGLYFPATAIIPVTLGVFLNAKIPVIDRLMTPQATLVDVELADLPAMLPEIFGEVYATLLSSLALSEWLITAVIFALVIILVHVASRQAIDFAKEIAIALGCVMLVFGFIMSVLVVDDTIGIGSVILWTLVSGVIALLVRFFDSVLDYQRAESVQFEDDNNYYHVRIVPKVILTRPKRTVKRIRPEEPAERPAPRPRPPRPEE
ncbi:MAG: hypothetical protein FWB88_10960 [Defluviitaleaceae bacterium]|nr:hypothetical protein [Defluviitaleaceae bacterium]MCL2240152.1 hypothetical protein [Defluviitaleaceae bacterium]